MGAGNIILIMPLIQIDTPNLEIAIPDFIKGDTVIKRVAELFTMIYNQATKQLSITWVIKHFAKNTDGTKGEYLGAVIPDWSKTSIADNTTMCDVANGHPIQKIDTGEVDEDGNPIFDYNPQITYMGQYDFFWNLAQTQPVEVHNMIINFGGLVESWDK